MYTTIERTPSKNGIGSGLHIGKRPAQPTTQINQTNQATDSDKIGTQHPNNPAPSRRGYA